LTKEEIDTLVEEHQKAPHTRILQKALAKEITIRVHSQKDYESAVEASEILFGKGTENSLKNLSEDDFLSVFDGVPQTKISKTELQTGLNIVDLLADKCAIFPSRGEARKMLQGGGVAINKVKMEDPEALINDSKLINNKYLLVQKGKKNYYLLIAE
jgi:tyrosyl-tRNA synthetase